MHPWRDPSSCAGIRCSPDLHPRAPRPDPELPVPVGAAAWRPMPSGDVPGCSVRAPPDAVGSMVYQTPPGHMRRGEVVGKCVFSVEDFHTSLKNQKKPQTPEDFSLFWTGSKKYQFPRPPPAKQVFSPKKTFSPKPHFLQPPLPCLQMDGGFSASEMQSLPQLGYSQNKAEDGSRGLIATPDVSRRIHEDDAEL